MKICIYGIGAIGGLMAARLVQAGYDVSAVARGATLESLQKNGLQFYPAGSDTAQSHPIKASQSPAELGVQDIVIIAVKTTGLQSIAKNIAPLIGPDTTILSAMNGIPWWFFHGLEHENGHLKLDSVDPQEIISKHIPANQVIGCVTHLSATTPAPGSVKHIAGNHLIIGEPNGTQTPRLKQLCAILEKAGFDVENTSCIQKDIWFKLWGNMTMNPVSAITGAKSDHILDDRYVRDFMSRIMQEAAAVGARIGLPIEADPEQRHQVTYKLGSFKTSMLQDAEAGKPLELDALVTSVTEIAHQLEISIPWTESLLGISRLQAKTRGLYQY